MDINITLITLLVIILLYIPGFFLKRFYYTGQFTKQFNSGNFAERFITSIFWGLIVQCICITLASRFSNEGYESIREPITKFYADLSGNTLPKCSSSGFFYCIGYILMTIFIASLLGFFFHKFVRILRLDIVVPILRFTNYWNYYFKGDLIHLRGNRRKGKVIATKLDIVTDDGSGSTKMYSGFLAHYVISPITGDLETIVLTGAERWSKSKGVFVPVPGDSLVILCKTVLNLNLSYNIKRTVKSREDINNISGVVGLIGIVAILFLIPYFWASRLSWYIFIVVLILAIFDYLVIIGIVMNIVLLDKSKKTFSGVVGYLLQSLVTFAIVSFIIYILVINRF